MMNGKTFAVVFMLIFMSALPVMSGGDSQESIDQTMYVGDPGEVEYWALCVFAFNETDAATIEFCYMHDAVQELSNFEESHIRYCGVENATRENIIAGLDWLAEMADENDIVLYSHNGHGVRRNGEYGIASYELGFISVDDFDEKFDAITCDGLCVVFDSCLSGTFVSRGSTGISSLRTRSSFDAAVAAGIEGEGRVVLMSTRPRGLGFAAKAMDDNGTILDLGFSKFVADSLLQGSDSDLNGDEWISAEEMFSFARKSFWPYALLMCFALRQQIVTFLQAGFFIKAFPTIADGFDGELPICPVQG